MNLERLAEEFVKEKQHLAALTKRVDSIKELLKEKVAEAGIPDESGHIWLQAGKYQLQNQRRQADPYLDIPSAEAWAKDIGIFDEVKEVREFVDHDALAGWVYDHRKEVNPETGVKYEAEYRELFITPDPVYGFQTPKLSKGEQYDEY